MDVFGNQVRWSLRLGWSLFAGALGVLTYPFAAGADGAVVSVNVDDEAAEMIRGWRRAHGLDPADAQADMKLRLLFARMARQRSEVVTRDTFLIAGGRGSLWILPGESQRLDGY